MFEYRYSRKLTIHPTVACKAVLERLRALGCDIPGPDENWRIRRTYAGINQRSGGAWSWCLMTIDSTVYNRYNGSIGGYYPALLCAKEGATLTKLDHHTTTQTLDPPENAMRTFGRK